MKPSIEDVVIQFKHDVSRALSAEFIIAVCQSIGHSWRERQFDPVTTIQGFLLQILHGNTACVLLPSNLESPRALISLFLPSEFSTSCP